MGSVTRSPMSESGVSTIATVPAPAMSSPWPASSMLCACNAPSRPHMVPKQPSKADRAAPPNGKHVLGPMQGGAGGGGAFRLTNVPQPVCRHARPTAHDSNRKREGMTSPDCQTVAGYTHEWERTQDRFLCCVATPRSDADHDRRDIVVAALRIGGLHQQRTGFGGRS